MASKSSKTTFNLPSATLDEAIIYLSERFLRAARGIRVVKSPTEFCLLTLCNPVVDPWFSGKLPYAPGQITLIFHSESLSNAADVLIYVPKHGDRVLHTKPHLDPPNDAVPASATDALTQAIAQLAQQQEQLQAAVVEALGQAATNEPTANEGAQLNQDALMRVLAQAFQSSSRPLLSAIAQLSSHLQRLEEKVDQPSISSGDRADLQPQLDALGQQMTRQYGALQQQIKAIATQITDQITAQVTQAVAQTATSGEAAPPVPQTEEEWRSRIEKTQGTVGDYETYSTAYRALHADAPLFETPDWVMLCELDWAQRLCPALADLHILLYGPNGIGDEGADILQQFGTHCRDGQTYYLYEEQGYGAEAAMQDIAHNPDYSWLPVLRRLWQQLKTPYHRVFQLFGWQPEAIAALEAITKPPQWQNRWDPETQPSREPSLQDYRAMLNIAPFTPLTEETVKRAYRQAMKTAHPDSGGSTQKAQQVNEAYQAVMRHYFSS